MSVRIYIGETAGWGVGGKIDGHAVGRGRRTVVEGPEKVLVTGGTGCRRW